MAWIECRDLDRFFGSGENRVHVLKNIGLNIEKGEFVAIVGQSGSGKTTLMNILGCLDKPDAGSYKVCGEETALMDADALARLRRRRFGFIFQRYNLLPDLSAEENTALPAVYAGAAETSRLQRARRLLADLGLGGKERNKPSELSGGQQQRVSIARALMNGGEIIFADEPTGALDSASGKRVMEIIRSLHRQGCTVIMVTHDADIAGQADRIVEIRDGEIVSDKRLRPYCEPAAALRPDGMPTDNGGRVFKETVKMSLKAVAAHKMRSLLTMLGIIIGIAAVVSVVALGTGSQEKILSDINAIGTNTITIRPGKGFGDRQAAKIRTLTAADAEVLSKQSYVESAAPLVSAGGSITFRQISAAGVIYGSGEQYLAVRGLKLAEGRFFDEEDVAAYAQVAVIDTNLHKTLFADGIGGIGSTVLFNKRPLRIIGIARQDNGGFGSSNLQMWVPYTTLSAQIGGGSHIQAVTVKLKEDADPQVAERSIGSLLEARHGAKDFFMQNSDSIRQTVESTTGTMTVLISSIALISLAVGGIGVMNIMLVSVSERTREIGVRMAIGARQSDIRRQFLTEAVLICLAGGLAGIVLSGLIGLTFDYFAADFPMRFSWRPIAAATAFSAFVGIVFGLLPANRAAGLKPVDALAQD
ncbi:MAG: MacB family efflux pump subunit [Neisseria sp.]|nr:MacB family efflux pump subunit [Neisseria sp.]